MLRRLSVLLAVISLVIALLAFHFPNRLFAQAGEIHGTIAKVDVAANSLTIKTPTDQEKTVTLDAKTEIRLGEKPATTADLKEGQQVKIIAEGIRALSVEVLEQTALLDRQ